MRMSTRKLMIVELRHSKWQVLINIENIRLCHFDYNIESLTITVGLPLQGCCFSE
ncbi:short-chain dehydrogenase reductase 3a-like [Iris pallida]|uniref:Short-chain dehydrogenase reductase 3a-like n=1 Tax=Iris pallida TaxID=29817 RepID=A0AAX6IHY9_IRIPA|nr:short-chain dehydrogenase reductase 3a-like [Iris pallida]